VVCHMNLALIQGLAAGLDADRLNPVLDPEPKHCCVTAPCGHAMTCERNNMTYRLPRQCRTNPKPAYAEFSQRRPAWINAAGRPQPFRLTKMARLVEQFAAQPQAQERLTMQVARCPDARPGHPGVGVVPASPAPM
jgi:hypothetical protein